MGYRVQIAHTEARVLERIARGDRTSARRITEAVLGLREDPRPAGATKMVGMDAWRLRVGDYRVVYLISDSVQVVEVTRIGHRRDVYDRR